MRRRKGWFCYMVRCADGSLYTGIATDVEDRVKEHNSGSGARYTSGRHPVTLVWSEEHPSESSVRSREAQIKRWRKAKKEFLVGVSLDCARDRRIPPPLPIRWGGRAPSEAEGRG